MYGFALISIFLLTFWPSDAIIIEVNRKLKKGSQIDEICHFQPRIYGFILSLFAKFLTAIAVLSHLGDYLIPHGGASA